jgi:DNA-binding transcriptional regulator YiaG
MDATLEGHLHRRCGGHYAQAVETVTIRLSGMSAKVDRELFRCDKCGDVQHTVEQREAAEREAVLTMRHDHALLTGKEIRQFRDALGLSAELLGGLLHGLPRGIVEGWEKGRYLQSPTVDAMIRSLADPEERERRAAKAGLLLPALPGAEGTAPTGSAVPTTPTPSLPALPAWAVAHAAAVAATRAAERATAAAEAEAARVAADGIVTEETVATEATEVSAPVEMATGDAPVDAARDDEPPADDDLVADDAEDGDTDTAEAPGAVVAE